MRRPFQLDEDSVQLPRGTRVVLKVEVRGEDGFVHRPATVATVREVAHNNYTLETPSKKRLVAQRDQIVVQRPDLLPDLGQRQWDFRRLRENVIHAAVVGSQAWGLSDAHSDEDVRGAFVAPFDDHVSLWDCPPEIASADSDAAYWEVQKLILQGLRGDANTLECLWSPIRKISTALGDELVSRRRMFVSMNVLGSFGRYAQSQFKKIERSLARDRHTNLILEAAERGGVLDAASAAALLPLDKKPAKEEVTAVVRSLLDRGVIESAGFESLLRAVAEGRKNELEPTPHRPKNAYNLLRLLHSCLSWLRTEEPLIVVEGPLRETLLGIKRQETPIEETIRMAQELAGEIDEAATTSRLRPTPDYRAADAFLRRCRREAALRAFVADGLLSREGDRPGPFSSDHPSLPRLLETPLPPDVRPKPLRRFLARYVGIDAESPLDIIWMALTGAHAYGFPSPDSDLDLKAVHILPPPELLGLHAPVPAVDFLGDFEGREYDLTSNDLGQSVDLLLKGNGNLLERFLGPFTLLSTETGHQLRALVKASLSKRSQHHYRGFFRGMRREYGVESARGVRKAKRLLYAYRVALTGIHLMRSGEVETHVRKTSALYGYEGRVDELIRIKQAAELSTLGESEDAPYLEDIARLETDLERAVEESRLPDDPANRGDFEAFVVRERLRRTPRE